VAIARLKKVTMVGMGAGKNVLLQQLQQFGELHLESLTAVKPMNEYQLARTSTRSALEYLLKTPRLHRQEHDESRFDRNYVERRAGEIAELVHERRRELAYLQKRIADLSLWGNFVLPDESVMGGLKLWFYVLPVLKLRQLAASSCQWQVIDKRGGKAYVVILADTEPSIFMAERTHTGRISLDELRQKLERCENDLEDLSSERYSLSRWCDQLLASMADAADTLALEHAGKLLRDDNQLFVLNGWIASAREMHIRQFAETAGVAVCIETPSGREEPPTLLENPAWMRGAQHLVTFYLTPTYQSIDPTPAVFLFFPFFLAMIVSDAGYALLLAALLLLSWGKLSRHARFRDFRGLLVFSTLLALLWGVLCGSYFGLSPPAASVAGRLAIVDYGDVNQMMYFSVGIGALHVGIANLMVAWHLKSRAALANLGWVTAILSAALLWLAAGSRAASVDVVALFAYAGLGIALILILLYTLPYGKPLARAGAGLLALARINGAFGDVMSYLRLFALGLAGVSLATVFNDIASQVSTGLPGLGILFAGIILLLGHSLNLLLAVSGGVMHGLRLNFIEFFNWALSGEGRRFVAFARQGKRQWTS